MKIKVLGIACIVGLIGFGVLGGMTAGMNDAGFRTVVQYPTGTVKVHFEPGWYLKYFGTATVYPDAMTMDFDRDEAQNGAAIDQPGVEVQYGDGGTGTVYGTARFNLPSDPESMILLHKEARGAKGVAYKVIRPVVQEAANQTAGLMNSEDGYASKRGIFTQWTKSQITKGLFQTESKTEQVTDEATGKKTSKQVAVVKMQDGLPLHYTPDLDRYGITLATFQMQKPTFEEKTMKQISDKREATMAIITAKANAEKAKQDAITTEEQGKANVMKARYEKEVEKESAVVEAERIKEVALIAAAQRVQVAEQEKLEAEQLKLKAAEYKQEQILIGEGEAERKRLVMEADGALAQKLQTYENVMAKFAEEFGKQKWVPEVVLGGTTGATNSADQMMQMLTLKAAKDLSLETTVK